MTQFFFRCEDYLSLVDDLAARGVTKPVIPGIMPVTNVAQIERFAALSGAEVPARLRTRLHAAAGDPAEVRRIGVAAATELCAGFLAAGTPGFHFYTLNRSTTTREIWAALGLPMAAAAWPARRSTECQVRNRKRTGAGHGRQVRPGDSGCPAVLGGSFESPASARLQHLVQKGGRGLDTTRYEASHSEVCDRIN